ncbi:MAG TPA: adenylate/guanylate cyclase domain-containing protein [Thermoleophilaceae bacterium]|nr:adenylate/guanylate cyclase domain-containing protein [Thermoleophilaceae bacterium]
MELWRETYRRLTWASVGANVTGALVLFLLLGFLIPFAPDGADRQLGLNAALLAVYAPLTLALGSAWGRRMSAPVERWLSEDRAPTSEERRLALGLPFRFVLVWGVFWMIAAMLFTLLNASTSGWSVIVVGGSILLGGETTCAVGYLLIERITRPVMTRALAGGPPPQTSCGPGVRGRLMMAWSLGTGVPLLGIVMVAIAGVADGDEDPTLLAATVAFIAMIGFAVGLFAIAVASRSIADPIGAVRDGMARVEEGELDVSVPVDDGSEVGLLEAGFNRMAAGLRERERMRDLFGRHVGREVAQAALEEDGEVQLGGEVREVAVVFVDLVGSTALAGRLPPTEVVELLNDFFRIVVETVEEHGGWVNKFEGDAALCVFGAPSARPDPGCDGLRAARTLCERLEHGLRGVDAGIGVSAGPAVAGNVGTEERFEYTVIGDPPNEAARLSELAKRRPERLLASAAVVERAGREEAACWEIREEVVLRGRDDPTGVATPVRTRTEAPPSEARRPPELTHAVAARAIGGP